MSASSIFISYKGEDWILKILSDDIYQGIKNLGIQCRIGPIEDYNGEDVCYHMWWRTAVPIEKATINAVFITHTDDEYKEKELLRIKDQFDIFIPMSLEDEEFLIELGFDSSKVHGINLPTRNTYVRPMSVGIFSRCYSDKRKNEQWLLEYCKMNPNSRYVNFVFIGQGWAEFVSELSQLGCSFQWICASRALPYEYMYQQLELSRLDYYIYMGMDGGAMGAYDAYAMGVKLCISDDGYHKGIPDMQYSFATKDAFFAQLDRVISQQVARVNFFRENSVDKYVRKILNVFLAERKECNSTTNHESSVKQKRRDNYFPSTFGRRISYISNAILKWLKFQMLNR